MMGQVADEGCLPLGRRLTPVCAVGGPSAALRKLGQPGGTLFTRAAIAVRMLSQTYSITTPSSCAVSI